MWWPPVPSSVGESYLRPLAWWLSVDPRLVRWGDPLRSPVSVEQVFALSATSRVLRALESAGIVGTVTSGIRSEALQATLPRRARNGRSRHLDGLAVDFIPTGTRSANRAAEVARFIIAESKAGRLPAIEEVGWYSDGFNHVGLPRPGEEPAFRLFQGVDP